MSNLICRSNFRSELALRNHFKKAQCRSDFEGRNSQISLPSPQNNVLQYRTKSTCELSPLVVYADFEVFSKEVAGDASVLGVQNRVAAVGYAAVGMCGYNPPDSHRLCMIHAQEGEHECAVVVKFLVAMIDLSKDFKDWRTNRQMELVWKPGEQESHDRAAVCRECSRTFRAGSAGRGKVAHQLHGSGAFAGSLCQDCNKAAHNPTSICICFHNGGRYDFHFVLRAFAKFKAEARKALEDVKPAAKSKGKKLNKFSAQELSARWGMLRCSRRCLPLQSRFSCQPRSRFCRIAGKRT